MHFLKYIFPVRKENNYYQMAKKLHYIFAHLKE